MAALTTNASETTLQDLLSDNYIFSIPYFQRPYRFSAELLKKLLADLADLLDSGGDSHFFGAIITNKVPGGMADPKQYQVIDGQQRITTAYLIICGAVRSLIANKESEAARDIFEKYIVISGNTKSLSNIALHTGRNERPALNKIVSDLNTSGDFKFNLTQLPALASSAEKGRLVQNYKLISTFFKKQSESGGVRRVSELCEALLSGFRLIEINVTDPTDGPRIFDRLNSGQSPMTIGDLVRNDVFARGDVSSPTEIEKLDAQVWQPFYSRFIDGDRNYFDDYLFPFGIVKGPKWKKAEVYERLRATWKGLQPQVVIESLAAYQDDYLDLVLGTNSCRHEKDLALRFGRLYQSGLPSSIFPFLMRLSNETRSTAGTAQSIEAKAVDVLDHIESFLVRRAVCGIEPTGLHAVFRSLWDNLGGTISGAKFREVLESKHKTVDWPTNGNFEDALRNRALYETGILDYLLRELEASSPGDTSVREPFTVEHVLPQTYSDKRKEFMANWGVHFTKDEHASVRHTLANLIPISGPMNEALSQAGYDKKRIAYLKGSKFALARKLGDDFDTWTKDDLQVRANSLVGWALGRWPY